MEVRCGCPVLDGFFKGGVLGLNFYTQLRVTPTKAPLPQRRTGHPALESAKIKYQISAYFFLPGAFFLWLRFGEAFTGAWPATDLRGGSVPSAAFGAGAAPLGRAAPPVE